MVRPINICTIIMVIVVVIDAKFVLKPLLLVSILSPLLLDVPIVIEYWIRSKNENLITFISVAMTIVLFIMTT